MMFTTAYLVMIVDVTPVFCTLMWGAASIRKEGNKASDFATLLDILIRLLSKFAGWEPLPLASLMRVNRLQIPCKIVIEANACLH